MRGLPPFQALLLLIALVVLGFAGNQYIDMGKPISPKPSPPPQTTDHHHAIEAEIEFVFSSPPLSYTLKKPSVTGGEDQVILQSSSAIENPSYGNVNLVAHQLTTYWLDVVWPDTAKEGTHHFVQMNISPSHGEGQKFSFFGSSRKMSETFEYNTGGHHHE